MPRKSREQRLFGAACLKLSLQKTASAGVEALDIYKGALEDLGLTDEEVQTFLGEHRDDVERALDERRRSD